MRDLLVVGGGISGLYTAFLHLCHARRNGLVSNICIVAPHAPPGSNSSRDGGSTRGRICTRTWHGVRIQLGAGIVRLHKDRRILRLAHKLGVEVKVVAVPGPDPILAALLAKLRACACAHRPPPGETFQRWALLVLGPSDYAEFQTRSGFRDYEDMDARLAMQWYGFDDLLATEIGIIHWSDLTAALWRAIQQFGHRGQRTCTWVCGTAVKLGLSKLGEPQTVLGVQISDARDRDHGRLRMQARRHMWEYARHVVVATPASNLLNLLRRTLAISPAANPVAREWLLHRLRAQPFCRLYAIVHPDDAPELHARLRAEGVMAVAGPLQKISAVGPIPTPPVAVMGAQRRRRGQTQTQTQRELPSAAKFRPGSWIYQIAYADNANALFLHQLLPFAQSGEPNQLTLRAPVPGDAAHLQKLEELFPVAVAEVRLQEVWGFFWTEGTHTWTTGNSSNSAREKVTSGAVHLPALLRQIRAPLQNTPLTLVGEALGPYQGWTEGALWSVEAERDRIHWVVLPGPEIRLMQK